MTAPFTHRDTGTKNILYDNVCQPEHGATGLQAGATLAVTNDDAWRNVSMIETVILADLVR
jgi:hypothetical protein